VLLRQALHSSRSSAVEIEGNLVHFLLLGGPVSLKKTVRINATTIP
jgi:hypothetical protein